MKPDYSICGKCGECEDLEFCGICPGIADIEGTEVFCRIAKKIRKKIESYE